MAPGPKQGPHRLPPWAPSALASSASSVTWETAGLLGNSITMQVYFLSFCRFFVLQCLILRVRACLLNLLFF